MSPRCPKCDEPLPAGIPAAVAGLTVGDAMTANPVTLGPEESLIRAVEVMRLHGVRRLPILVGERLVGVLSEGDLKRAQPSTLSASQEEFDQLMDSVQVARIMINDPVTAAPGTPLVEAARTLQSTKFGALPVVEDGRLVGILTDNDLHRVLVGLLERAPREAPAPAQRRGAAGRGARRGAAPRGGSRSAARRKRGK